MIPSPTFLDYDTIMSVDLPPLVWDVEPLISRGDRVVIYGEFASLKSWIGVSLLQHLGTGRPWLNHFPIRTPRLPLYIDEEMNAYEMQRRMKRLGQGARIPSIPGFKVLSRSGVHFSEFEAHTLLRHLSKFERLPEVILVDSLRGTLPGDENTAKDIQAYWHHLEPLSRIGITVIVIHHMNKPPAQGKRSLRHRASGSTAILSNPDVAIAVERVAPGRACLTAIKTRSAQEIAPFVVELDDGGDRDGPIRLTLVEAHDPEEPVGADVFRVPA